MEVAAHHLNTPLQPAGGAFLDGALNDGRRRLVADDETEADAFRGLRADHGQDVVLLDEELSGEHEDVHCLGDPPVDESVQSENGTAERDG